MKNDSRDIWQYVDAKQEPLIALSDRVWATPELCYSETRSAAEHAAELERQGFRITRNVAGIPTAMIGEAGEDGPVIAILGEYDALPGLSQEAGIAEPRPLENGGNGHGCGHNLLGAGAMLAAVAVKDWLAKNGLKGRVRYYGCPAEEGGAAKTFMVREGAFDDVDAAISWHPASFCEVMPAVSLANTRIDFTFHGRASHAAASPHLGRSALDAVELMNVGVNYMREHMPSDARIHYALLETGGIAPNVVQHAGAGGTGEEGGARGRADDRDQGRAADHQRGVEPARQRSPGAGHERRAAAAWASAVRWSRPEICQADPGHAH